MIKKSKPSSGFGGLADALLKAGVVDQKAATKANNEHRRDRKELGADGIEKEKAERRDSFKQQRDEQVARSAAGARESHDVAGAERVRSAIRGNRQPTGGGKRWFYVTRDGRCPFVEVSPGLIKMLEDGQAGIVESFGEDDHAHVIVAGPQNLSLIRSHDPEMVRFWNGDQRGRRPPDLTRDREVESRTEGAKGVERTD